MVIEPAPHAHQTALALVNFGGFAVLERPDLLRYDEVIADRVARVLICGERRHLAWRVDMEALKDRMRADLRYRIETWERELGLA